MAYKILDLDGCISDDSYRIPRIKWNEEDPTARYHDYHMLCGFDRPANFDLFKPDPTQSILILTARPRMVEGITIEWLRRNEIDWSHLLMRETNEHTHSAELKRRQLLSLPSFGIQLIDIDIAYDDRPEIIEMYRSFGIRAEVKTIHNLNAHNKAED